MRREPIPISEPCREERDEISLDVALPSKRSKRRVSVAASLLIATFTLSALTVWEVSHGPHTIGLTPISSDVTRVDPNAERGAGIEVEAPSPAREATLWERLRELFTPRRHGFVCHAPQESVGTAVDF